MAVIGEAECQLMGCDGSRSTSAPKMAQVKAPVKTLVKAPEKIVDYLSKRPNATLGHVAAAIGKSKSAVARAAAKPRCEGRLRYVGLQKGGHWEISR